MKNKITIIGINFYPEDTSTGLYTTQLAEYLANYYEVDVITGFPYYPQWQIKESYKNKPKYIKEKLGNINIYRYKQYVPQNPTFKKRVLHLLSFTLGSIPNIFKVNKSDLVICVVPPTGSIILGWLLSKIKRAKLWIHIQDFEFDAAFEAGLVNNQNMFKYKIFEGLFWMEKKLLDSADIVSTISYKMLEKLKTKTKTETYYLPNWIDENFINPVKAKPHRYMQSDKFKILYSGNIGEKQDWEFFLKVIEFFKDYNDIEFIVVGDGARKNWLVERIKNYNYKNVKYYPPVSYTELSDLLCSADLHILFQKIDVIDTVMPSKILGMMASAKPSLVTGNEKSEVANIINESKGGAFFKSGDLESVLNFIKMINNNYKLIEEYGKNARNYVIKYFSKDKVFKNLREKIITLIEKDG